MAQIVQRDRGISVWLQALVLLGAMLAALFAAARGSEGPAITHAWIIFAVFAVWLIGLAMRYGSEPPAFPEDEYENGIVKWGVFVTAFWGVAGMLVGVVIALQLAFPNLFYFEQWGFTNFGRLRPVHTSAVIFAMGGNALIATSFYVVQRTCRARLAGGLWPWFVFWGYQAFIVI
ncbi:MAG: cbb3-type cytochrome c oxidase subunit I, partial [Maricaulaceae bacterium]